LKVSNGKIAISASDLVGYLNCNHLSALDIDVVNGSREKAQHYDPLQQYMMQNKK
jgi:uncharacterized protein